MFVPEGEPVDMRQEDGYVHIKVAKVEGHRMIALSYR